MNLYTSDITLKFMLDEISTQNSDLSIELLDALVYRINQRKTILSDIMFYLHEPNIEYENTYDCVQ